MTWSAVAFLLCCAGSVFSDPIAPPIPVQSVEPGTRYLPIDPPPAVAWDVFIDLNCPDSAAAWPIVKQVHAFYGSGKLDLVFQHLTVPYHRNSLVSTQGYFVIQNWNPALVFDYADSVLINHAQFTTAATVNKTETQVISELADVAVAATGIDKDFFISDIPNYRQHAIGLWKYASKRGVAAPPTYFVNGVDVVVGQAFVPTFDEWTTFFDTLITRT